MLKEHDTYITTGLIIEITDIQLQNHILQWFDFNDLDGSTVSIENWVEDLKPTLENVFPDFEFSNYDADDEQYDELFFVFNAVDRGLLVTPYK